ncbi:hypothetical protein H0H87_010473 [Tephrocybe sp. NHM501043]|nr:hypothetical protein H0H87_010473 [Tephrocybe sp. NHM501043]
MRKPAVDSSISLLEQLLFEHRPNQLNTSEEDTPLSHPLALLDVVDTPAVPGSWYGAGLTSIINASTEDPPVSEHESIHENQSCSLEECVAIHSSLHNESLLERPPTPPEMDQVFPSSNQSLANLLNGCQSMSDLALEDTKAQKEPAVDAVEVPLSAGYIEDVTAPDGQIFAPGVTFVKVWRMINTGIRDWPVNTEVVFVGGAQLTSGNPPPHIQSMCTVGPLKPGEDKNVWTPELKVCPLCLLHYNACY